MRDGIVNPALLRERDPKIVVRIRFIGLKPKRFFELCDGFFGSAFPGEIDEPVSPER